MRENVKRCPNEVPRRLATLSVCRRLCAAYRISISATVVSLLIAASACPVWAGGTFYEIKASWQPSDTLILDRHGETLHRLRTDASVRRGQWVALADVSPALRTALVLSEDKRFYEHSGVDWQAVSAAAWANLFNRKTRGASTITMQLAGLLDDDLKRNTGRRSTLQKIKQSVSAEWLEQRLRKDQILEAYLNLVPFRGELVGIDALSQTLFGKAPHGLDEREAAVTAALVRAPNALPAQVAQRACAVLKDLHRSSASAGSSHNTTSTSNTASSPGAAMADIAPTRDTQPASATTATGAACEALDFFTAAALQRRDYPASDGIAPHVAQQVTANYRARQPPPVFPDPAKTRSSPNAAAGSTHPLPATISTTLHAPLQRFAVQTLQQQLRELRGRHVEDGAVVVLDNASGQVLAWVGSSGDLSQASEVDGVTALRQPGSTLKPFLYAQAIAARRLTAASLLEDSSTQIQTSGGLYIPQNYDHQFKGWVSVRTALGASLNVPAVRALVLVSPDAFHRQLVQLGLPLKESGDYYGYSLALGSAEVSLLDLTNAYRTLASGGRFSPTRLLPLAAASSRQGLPASSIHETATGASPPHASLSPKREATHPDNSPAGCQNNAFPRKGNAGVGAACSAQALDARAAFIVSDILADPLARARTFGTDSVLATRFWSAVKTGTSKDMRDNWAIGYSRTYTVGVWVGNASGAPMWDVSGTTGAAPIWAALMNHLHASQPSQAPRAPAGLVHANVRFNADLGGANTAAVEAVRQEWFLQGTQQSLFTLDSIAGSTGSIRATSPNVINPAMQTRNQHGAPTGPHQTAPGSAPAQQLARIAQPTHGSIIALDPDIPPQHQRVRFEAVGQNLRWQVDGKPFARGPSAHWLPWPGRHRVQLVNAQGRVLDEVQLEVRGAGIKPR